jgi:hypothetical protein
MNPAIQTAEIARIAEMLAPMCDGDEGLLADMLEGETEIDRLLARLWEQVARDTETLTGIKERSEALSIRKKRTEARRDTFKAAIGKVLRAGKLSGFQLPEVTFSVRDGSPKLEIVDPSAVPTEYLEPKYAPSMTAIKDAFADAGELPNWLTRVEAKDVVTARTK